MSQEREKAKATPSIPVEPAEVPRDDNSLAAAAEDATREIEKRHDAGGYGGFGDIG
jgi:hypothetical protein